MRSICGIAILLIILILIPVSAYNVTYNVSPIANSYLTMTAANITRGANISVLRSEIVGSGTTTISLTGTTLVVGSSKVATVGLRERNVSNISVMNRAAITFPVNYPQNGTISNVSLILYLNAKATTFGAPDLIISNGFEPTDPTNQVILDWRKFITASTPTIWNATPVTFQSWTASTRKEIFLNSAAKEAIARANRLGNEGNITISLRDEWDVTNNNRTMIWTALTAQAATYTFGSMQAVVHAQDPMLNISYYMPDRVGSLTPISQFSVNLTPGPEGMTAQFFSQANNTIPGSTKYNWNFTDGGTKEDSDLENPTFVYTTAGTYTVRLSVVNPGPITNSMTKTNYIRVFVPAATPTPCPTVTPCPSLCDDYTTSLLHYEGADHSTDIIDENTANSWILRDVGEITTTQQKFGVSSYQTTDASSMAEMTVSPASTLALGKENWTWETWIMYDNIDPATDHGIFSWDAYGAGHNADIFYQRDIAGDGSYVFNIYDGIVTDGSFVYHNQAGEYNANQWYHLELSRNASFINFSIDGDQKVWDHISGSFDENTDMGNPVNMTYGYENHDAYYLDGWMDETRLSVGIQRHWGDFAVATSAYDWDPCTSSGGVCMSGYNTTSYFHDLKCLPIELEYLFIAIGFVALISSRLIKQYGVFTAIISPLSFAIAAWYANYICKNFVEGFSLNGNPFMLHTQIIIPVPVLAVLMVVCFLISLINLISIYFLNRPEPEEMQE